MEILKSWSVWSALVIALGLLLVGVVLQLLDLFPYGLVLAKIAAGLYRVYFIWEWISIVLRERPERPSLLDLEPRPCPKEKVHLMTRFVLTILAFVFVSPLENKDLMVSYKPQAEPWRHCS